jgi:hypothetical protein
LEQEQSVCGSVARLPSLKVDTRPQHPSHIHEARKDSQVFESERLTEVAHLSTTGWLTFEVDQAALQVDRSTHQRLVDSALLQDAVLLIADYESSVPDPVPFQ